MRSSRNVFITNLAVADVLLSLTLIPLVRLPQLNEGSWYYGSAMCKFFNTFSGTNVFCSALTIVAIAADRFYSIKAAAPKQHGRRFIIPATVAVWLVSVLCCIPLALYYELDETTLNLTRMEMKLNLTITNRPANVDVIPFAKTCKFDPRMEIQILMTIIQTMFLLPVPLTSLSVYNYKLHRFLRENRNRQANILSADKLAKERNHHRRLSLLLGVMALSYALLWLPFTLITCIIDLLPSDDLHQLLYRKLNQTFLLVAYCSLCVNPFLYGYFNKNFRRAFRALLCRAPSRPRGPPSTRRLIGGQRLAVQRPSNVSRFSNSYAEPESLVFAESRLDDTLQVSTM